MILLIDLEATEFRRMITDAVDDIFQDERAVIDSECENRYSLYNQLVEAVADQLIQYLRDTRHNAGKPLAEEGQHD